MTETRDRLAGKRRRSALDVQAQVEEEEALLDELDELADQAGSTTQFERVWRLAHRRSGWSRVTPWSPKQKGQIHHIQRALKGETGVCLVALVEDWTDFLGLLRREFGVQKSPSRPNIGYILTHLDAVLAWWAEAGEETPQNEGEETFEDAKVTY